MIELESCITLKHRLCWNPKSRLRTSREEGAGLGQLTRAFKQNGTIRFDNLAIQKSKYPKELRELSWQTIYDRPDLQIRAIVLQLKYDYNKFKPNSFNTLEALAFTDAAYNGGYAGVISEQRACKLANNCDPSRWFDNVENYCLKSKVALYGNRSACDINREHVEQVLLTRSKKYMQLLK